jgi:Domain of unknown function (DUF4406)
LDWIRTMKVYIAGPMTGYPKWNFPAFFEAEAQLEALGYEVINPAHNDGATVQEALESAGPVESPNNLWSDYMKRDLPHVLNVDMICLLPGWQNSKGASLEVTVAKAIGLPLMVLKDGKLIPRVTVLGLSGYARSGKDTVADHLVNKYGYTKMSFADPMKQALITLDPMIDLSGTRVALSQAISLGWDELKKMSSDIRPLLQRMGTEVGRNIFGQDFWVEQAISKIPDGSTVVFADVRFPNEAEAIKKLGGQVWRVERLDIRPANDHISEHALDGYKFDVTINNFDTLDNLYQMVDGLKNDGY